MPDSIDLTTVYSSRHAWKAHLVRHALEEAGIEPHVADERAIRMN